MSEKVDMVSLPKKSFWKLSIPIIAFCFFDAIYGIVDMAWVSQISVKASFAVGVSIPFVTLIFSFGDSIGQGTNSIMSRFMGSDDYESAYNALVHGLILSNIIWLLIVICALFAQGLIFDLDPNHSYVLVFDYLVPLVVFAYIFIFVKVFAETLPAEGNSRTPTILIVSSNILNIILDPIFIFNFDLGIKGAAYATVLSSAIPFIIFIFLYLSGRTKIPLSLKYFKFNHYILVEILKVALPNFLDAGLWAFTASFVNSILIATTGDIGPILYSVSNKFEALLISPVRGYGRALMSVTGHLFGAREFSKLNEMFKYTLKVSVITSAVVMIIFIILREYAFSFFSITGMETAIFWITVAGTIIMISLPFSRISSKMLDGFGKSMYSLLFTFLKIVSEVCLIYVLFKTLSNEGCVLIGITVTDIVIAIVYYVFLRYLFKNFDKKYENKATVKTFNSNDESKSLNDDTKWSILKKNSIQTKILMIIALIAMIIIVIEILLTPIEYNDYYTFLCAIASLAICTGSIYLIRKLNRPKIALLGFIILAVMLFTFMGSYGNLSILLFIITQIFIIYIIIILRKLKKKE